MNSYLQVEQGVYQPGRRFAFTNDSDKEFKSYWDRIPVVVKPHETIELSDSTPFPGSGMGHCLAVKFATELVDRIMQEDKVKAGLMAVPDARKPYEDRVLKPLGDEDGNTAQMLARMKAQEILADASRVEGISYEGSGQKEFAEVPKGGVPTKAPAEKKAVKTKAVKE